MFVIRPGRLDDQVPCLRIVDPANAQEHGLALIRGQFAMSYSA